MLSFRNRNRGLREWENRKFLEYLIYQSMEVEEVWFRYGSVVTQYFLFAFLQALFSLSFSSKERKGSCSSKKYKGLLFWHLAKAIKALVFPKGKKGKMGVKFILVVDMGKIWGRIWKKMSHLYCQLKVPYGLRCQIFRLVRSNFIKMVPNHIRGRYNVRG